MNVKIGDVTADFVPNTFYTVIVKKYKFDTIRQEAYWVTIHTRQFKTRVAAQSFIDRNKT